MKKIVSLLLVLVMVLGLCACGSTDTADTTTGAAPQSGFMVGYGEADITPESGVPMGGYGRSEQRISIGLLNYLKVTCVAITDGDDNTILLYSMDLTSSGEPYKLYAGEVSEATGVPVDNILMSASHTHSAPDYSCTDYPGMTDALRRLRNGLVKAGEAAMADRKEVTMSGGSIETEGLNFVRHYVCNDGTYAGANFGSGASGYARHVSDADPVLQLIKFTREGGKDVYLTNFQTHPHRTGGSDKFELSSDIVGEYRTALEKALDCRVVYFSGAGGNINPTSRIASENVTDDFREQGQALAEYAQKVELTQLATGKVQVRRVEFTADINHEWDSYAAICRELRERWNKGEITTAQVTELGLTYGIKLNSPYHAGAIANRANKERTGTISLWTYSFGDVGVVGAPYEMFDTNGVYIREHSPFAMTFVATCSNGGGGYLPSDASFEYGCYETDTSLYARGTAEKLAEQYVAMLNEQYGNR